MNKFSSFFLVWFAFLLCSTSLQAQSPLIEINSSEERLDEALERNIRSYLRITGESCDTPLVRLERLRPQVLESVSRAGQALGYYRLSSEAIFSVEENCWQLMLNVQAGDPVRITQVSISLPEEAMNLAVFQEVLAGLPMLEGEQLNHGEYDSIKNALSAAAVENGFFGARFERAEVRLDLQVYQAEILIEFEPGPRYRIGEITVSPVEGFSESFISSMITLETGQPYSSELLLAQRNGLDETLYFRQVSISPQLSFATNQSVPVTIDLTPRLRHAWSAGVGFTTDTGPRVRGAYENRYINSRGHTLTSDAAISAIRSQINMGYGIPLNDPLTTSLHFNTGYITEDTDTYDSDRFKLEAVYRLQSSSGWLESYAIDYLLDDFVLDQQADTTSLTMLGYSLSKTLTDDFISPSRGWKLFGQIRGASDSVLSDTTFLQLYTSGKGIFSIGGGRLITRFEAGTTLIDEVAELPVSVRFFAGGDQSIRGYKYQSLGPLNNSDEVVGGKHLLIGSAEYDFPVRNNWRGAIFYDGGNAFSSDKLEWKKSVGIGVRWLSPIGPIRADLAHALDDEGGVRLHITMGPDL